MKRMINYKTWMLGLLALVLAGCSEELLPVNDGRQVSDGDKVAVSVGLDFMDPSTPTRAMGEISDADRLNLAVRLFVFDADGYLVETVDVPNGTTDGNPDRTNNNTFETGKRNETKFWVELTKSNKERRIHFVAVRLAAGQTFDDVVTIGNLYGTEASVMNSMSVSGTQDAYWQRVVIPGGIPAPTASATTVQIEELQRVPLIRNFAKFTLAETIDNFEITGFVVMNIPTEGTVAPYNTTTSAFEPFYVPDADKIYMSKKYFDITYTGFLPSSDVERANTDASTLDDALFNDANPKYMYESPNADGDLRGKTYILLKGRYRENASSAWQENRYYKLDIIYQDETTKTTYFYNILRNFHYDITLNAVSFAGYGTAAEAARRPASNNISASIEAQGVNNIADSHNRLFVSKLYFAYMSGGVKPVGTNLTTDDLLFKYRHVNQDNWENFRVGYTILDGSDDIFVTEGNSWTGAMQLNDGNTTANSYANVNGTTANGWSSVRFNLKEPGDIPQTATVRFYSTDDGYNTLSRDVTILLHKPYEMKVECPELVRGATGTAMDVNLLLPVGINAGLFPLTFYLEPVKKTIYPDAELEAELPVHIGQTIITGQSYNSYQYERHVTAEEYESAEIKVVDGVSYRVIPSYFKTSVNESATTVYATNQYFTTAYDNFQNGTTVFPTGHVVTITPTEYYGIGNTYITLSFSTTAAATITYSVTEGTVTTQYTYNAGAAGVHNIQVPTTTFASNNYSVSMTGRYVGETTQQSISGVYNSDWTYGGSGFSYPVHRHILHLPHLAFETNIGSQGFATREYIRVRRNGTVNCGRVYLEAHGIWGDAQNNYYNIDTDYNAAVLEASTPITFTQEGDNNTGWTTSITAGEITSLHKVDQDAHFAGLHLLSEEEAAAQDAAAPAGGLYQRQLIFAAP